MANGAAGVSFAGVWYPGGAGARAACQADGTSITDADVRKIARGMPGTPVTYEHAGVGAAASATADTDARSAGAGARALMQDIGTSTFYNTGDAAAMAMAPIGVITNAWVDGTGAGHCTGRVNSAYPGAASLVRDRALSGLSLSHFDGETDAIEVTLTADPARLGCNVATTDLSELPGYMRKHHPSAKAPRATMSSSSSSAAQVMDVNSEPAAAAPAASPLEAILTKMSPEERAVVQARFEEMDAAAVTATARAKTLESSATDAEILRDQIKQVTDQLSEAERKQYNLGMEAISEQMMSSNPDRVRRGADRLLMACSRRMMQMPPPAASSATAAAAPPAKRARAEEPAAAAAAPHFAPPLAGGSDALRRALASTYEPGMVE